MVNGLFLKSKTDRLVIRGSKAIAYHRYRKKMTMIVYILLLISAIL